MSATIAEPGAARAAADRVASSLPDVRLRFDYEPFTSVVWPTDTTKSFNLGNRHLEFDEVRTLKTFPFRPNQCLVFVKTASSWHMVSPMTGADPTILRRTLTINIERP